jgi:sugar O-acyltransferase (sialic acid O-acetyltransferase NeuD family)
MQSKPSADKLVVIGAKGFAKEVLNVLDSNSEVNDLHFFDNVSHDLPDLLFGEFVILRTLEELEQYFLSISPYFCLGIGGSTIRKMLCDKASNLGGSVQSIIADSALISRYDVQLGHGLSIMHNVIIEPSVSIGDGCLLNKAAIISHDVTMGQFCEVSPGAELLGRVTVGDFTEIGSNATVLPDVTIGSYVKVGAGAVVTKDVPDNVVVVGVPARETRKV